MAGLYTTPPVQYVSPDGIDASGRGTFEAPWKTISYANSNATSGWDNIICLRRGIYQENNISSLKHPIMGYPGETVTIDANGESNIISATNSDPGNRCLFQNLRFVRFTSCAVYNTNDYNGFSYSVNQCFFKPYSKNGSTRIIEGYSFNDRTHWRGTFNNCTFISLDEILHYYNSTFSYGFSTQNCLFWDVSSFQASGGSWTNFNLSNTQSNNAYMGATKPGCIDSASPTTYIFGDTNFVNLNGGNYALKPDAPLRGAGYNGANIGAAFRPVLQIGGYSLNSLNSLSNDSLWWDTTLNGGVGGPGTDAIAAKESNPNISASLAVFQSNAWKIDDESANTARIRSPVYDLGYIKFPQALGWAAYEDDSLLPDNKLVIDNSLNDSIREIEYRGNQSTIFDLGADDTGLTIGWSPVSKLTNLGLLGHTKGIRFLQIRVLMTKIGK